MKKIISLLSFIIFSYFLFMHNTLHANELSEAEHIQAEATKGTTFLNQGAYDEAYAIFNKLLRMDPENESILLGYARSALRTKNYGQAIIAYEMLLERYPNEPLLLQELAYTHNKQDEFERAAFELAKNTQSSAKENEELLDSWKDADSRVRLDGRVFTGLIYDSNVNSGPPSNDINIQGFNLTLTDGKQIESLAAYVGGQLDFGYRLSEEGPWWFVANGGAYARYNFNKNLNDLNLDSSESLNAAFGIRYLGNKTMLDVRARAFVYDYAFMSNIFTAGAQATFLYAPVPNIHLITSGEFDHREYSQNSDYTGTHGSIGQNIRFIFGELEHKLTLGARYYGTDTNRHAYSYDAFELRANFEYILPYRDISLTPFISYSEEHYAGTATVLDTENRVDEIINTGIHMNLPLVDAWDMSLSYQYVNQNSNSDLYTYDKHIVNMGISYEF